MPLTSKQEQHAGDSSNQYQINQVTINKGLTENQATKVFQDLIPVVLSSYKDMAARIAEEHINQFKNKLLPRIEKVEGAFENFKDPAFQMQLRRAQMSAAVSDQESDLDMLSQLMINHIEAKGDRNKKLGIKKAIEIIGEIDNQALLALTVLYVFLCLIPIEDDVNSGLNTLEELYSKILYQELPKNNTWIEHLEILNTIKIYQYDSNVKINDICTSMLEGYAAAGIKKGSANFNIACNFLHSVGMDTDVFITNPLLEGYLLLPVVNKNELENLSLNKYDKKGQLSSKEIKVLHQIFDLYDNGEGKEKAIKNFIELWDEHPNLKRIHDWTDKIPFRIDLNIVGAILSTTNIIRVVPELKNLNIMED